MRLVSKPGQIGGLRMAVAVLCALLIAFAGVVQVAHAHQGSFTVHPDCALCLAVHITVHPTQSPAPPVLTHIAKRIELSFVCAPGVRLFAFALFTRPPPATAAAG